MFVYWIKRPDHYDILTEGYVGVSKDPSKRFKMHKAGHRSKLGNRLRKYSDAELVIVFEGTDKECLLKEHELRPQEFIGWNHAAGGCIPPKVATEVNKLRGKANYSRSGLSKWNGSEQQKLVVRQPRGIRSKTHCAALSAAKKGKQWDNPMNYPELRLKVSESKIGTTRLYKDNSFKMAKPNTAKWDQLILEGYSVGG